MLSEVRPAFLVVVRDGDRRGGFIETAAQLVSRSPGKRRYRTVEEKRRNVEETLSSELSVAVMARRHGVNANQLFWFYAMHCAAESAAYLCRPSIHNCTTGLNSLLLFHNDQVPGR